MANIIDSLVVELGLDARQFTAEQKKVLDQAKKNQADLLRGGKEAEDAAKRQAQAWSAAQGKVVGFLASFLGARALVNFARDLTTADAALFRTAKTLDMSTKELSTWGQAAKRFGGDVGTISSSMGNFQNEIETWAQTGESRIIPRINELKRQFKDLNFEFVDGAGKARPVTEIYKNIGEAFSRMTVQQANVFGQAFGMDPATVQLLREGGEGINKILNDVEKLGTVTPQQAKAAQDLANAWHNVSQAAESIGRAILTWISPGVTAYLNNAARAFAELAKGKLLPESPLARFLDYMSGDSATKGKPAADFMQDRRGLFEQMGGAGLKGDAKLRMKAGANARGGATIGTMALARSLQSEIPELDRFTALDDDYHAGRKSKHNEGLAVDFTIKDEKKAAAIARRVRERLRASGINATVLDEYNHPSAGSTGGHIHVQFSSPEDAARYGQQAGVSAAVDNSRSSSSTSTSETNIGTVVVNPARGQDAGAAAGQVIDAARRGELATQANSGPGG